LPVYPPLPHSRVQESPVQEINSHIQLQQATGHRATKHCPPVKEFENLFPCSQDAAAGLDPVPGEPSPLPITQF